MATKDMRTIKSARRVLEILEYFDRDHRVATVMDISRQLDYPQSSTSELLRCLARLGYLHYNRFRRTYSPTARVALLGSWVEPALFRGGTLLNALDRVAERVGETVVLSTAANYVLQHLHVVEGASADAVIEHAGQSAPLLHTPQGRLLLASYQDDQIKSAVHRLNAEETDPARVVRLKETVEELSELRRRGWLIQPDARGDGTGVIAVLLPKRKGLDRLALSVVASREVIEARSEEILKIMLAYRRAMRADQVENQAAQKQPAPIRKPDTVAPAALRPREDAGLAVMHA
jgi:IclR family KDG regulon transcriptional repressor